MRNINYKDIYTEKNDNGTITASYMNDNYRIKRIYSGYTLKEIKNLFRNYLINFK